MRGFIDSFAFATQEARPPATPNRRSYRAMRPMIDKDIHRLHCPRPRHRSRRIAAPGDTSAAPTLAVPASYAGVDALTIRRRLFFADEQAPIDAPKMRAAELRLSELLFRCCRAALRGKSLSRPTLSR